jgi:predicted nucleic acid-binding protein
MRRAFVDTNVLFPFSVMDLMLALTEDGVHDVLWTEKLLAEWVEVVTRDGKRSTASAHAITSAIREFFPESQVPEGEHARLVAAMPGQDPDDRHHMAAAIAGGASAIVTWNLADFPAGDLAEHGVQVIDPDEYLCALGDDLPEPVLTTLARLAGEKRRPPLTALDLVDALHRAGVVKFAAFLRRHLSETHDQTAPDTLVDHDDRVS